jgi:hypothetical protein
LFCLLQGSLFVAVGAMAELKGGRMYHFVAAEDVVALSPEIDVAGQYLFSGSAGWDAPAGRMVWQEGNGWKRKGEGAMIMMSFPTSVTQQTLNCRSYFHFHHLFSLLALLFVVMELAWDQWMRL